MAAGVLSSGAPTDDEYMRRVIIANRIYTITGQPCHPWEVDDYPEDWIQAINVLAVDVPRRTQKRAEQMRKMQGNKNKWQP